MAASLEIGLLANGPPEAAGVPEDVPVLGDVLEHGSVWGPVHPFGGHFVATIAVGVGGAQDVQAWADDVV